MNHSLVYLLYGLVFNGKIYWSERINVFFQSKVSCSDVSGQQSSSFLVETGADEHRSLQECADPKLASFPRSCTQFKATLAAKDKKHKNHFLTGS